MFFVVDKLFKYKLHKVGGRVVGEISTLRLNLLCKRNEREKLRKTTNSEHKSDLILPVFSKGSGASLEVLILAR